jgi:hypothetical protein
VIGLIARHGLAPGPGPDEARRLLERELTDPAYRPGLLERLAGWLDDLVSSLTGSAAEAGAPTHAAALLVALVLVVAVTGAIARVRRDPAAPHPTAAGGVAPHAAPEEHRRRALAALASGDHEVALVEAFRALAARALARGLLPHAGSDGPGLTARELADALGQSFPDRAGELARAAERFDAVFYGHRDAADDDARGVLALDETLRRARPAGFPTGDPTDPVDPPTRVPR